MKTIGIFVLLVAILVSPSNGQLFSWFGSLLGGSADTSNQTTTTTTTTTTTAAPVTTSTAVPVTTTVAATSSFNFWDPFNLFGTASTATTTVAPKSNVTTTTTTSAPFNPFGFITGTFNALGSTISNVGNGLVTLVTGPQTTTPFPYPQVAAFLSNPANALANHGNATVNANVVQCLGKLIQLYIDFLIRIGNFLPGCISGLTLPAVFLVPDALGLLPLLNLIGVPAKTLSECQYTNGCYVKAVQTTINEMLNTMGGIASSLSNILPGVSNLGKSTVDCLANQFNNLAKDLPTMAKSLTCLQQ